MISCFQLKPCVKCFETCLKGFKLKMMVVEPKTIQLVVPDEELIDLFNSIGQKVQKTSLFSKTFVQLIKVKHQPIEVRSRFGQGAVEVQWSPVEH